MGSILGVRVRGRKELRDQLVGLNQCSVSLAEGD
jgi:hypothetical protein